MRNAGLDKAQSGIKTTGRNTNNLRYADDTTLMAENEEELKSLLMKVKDPHYGFPGGTVVKNLPANAGDARDGVQSLGWEDLLE